MTNSAHDSSDSLFTPSWRQAFRRRLMAWYGRHARDLPWRRSRDPYRIWVSEIMLQQTQVATVAPYFERFVAAFPTVAQLAAADEQQVLRLWEGLGYYRRARQLHRAAGVIVAEHDGAFPSDPAAVRDLPGIGRYTAGAILSIAFDAREPILEANTVRLFSRLLAYDGDPATAAGRERLWRAAAEVLPRRATGLFNQALMELGGSVCTPRRPRCDACPAAMLCAAHAQNRQEEIPRPSRKLKFEAVQEAAIVVERRGRVLLRQCAPGERWSGLWDFPRFAVANLDDQPFADQMRDGVHQLTGVMVDPREQIATLRHGVTRFRITLECHRARYRTGFRPRPDLQWAKPSDLDAVPLSTTGRKLSRLLVDEA